MCGIAGIFNNSLSQTELKNKITKMINAIQHRGPDSINVLIGKKFGVATSRLSIEKIKEGYQPITTESKRYVASFNGEIFNYKELIKKYNFSKKEINSEVKLLGKLFETKGVKFISEIKGQFVISIYDIKTEKIYLFRDRYGIRPIFYKIDDNLFIYSSEIKSIGAYYKQPLKTSLSSLANNALFWSNINSSTSFEEVHQLPPGNYLIFNKGQLEISKYWINPLADYKIKESKNLNFYKILKDSVKRQIHGEAGFSSYLSGGIDSSIIAYLLTEIQGSPIDTFSIEFENKEYDESNAQKKIQKFINSNHFSLKITNEDIVNNFEKVINHSEAHLFRTAPVPMYLLAKFVKESGHKVVFTGEGADEILLGYDLFSETKIRKFWSKFPESLKRPQLLKKLYYYLPQFKNDRYFEITKQFYKKSLNYDDINFYSHTVRWDQYFTVKNFFKLDNEKFNQNNLIDAYKKKLPKNFQNLEIMKKAQIIEIDTLLSGYLLSSQGDRMTMAHGIEGRYPYLDDIFTSELAKIPSTIKLPSIKSKNILRDAFKNYLPRDVVNRPKFAYQAPEAKVFFNNKKGLKIVDDFEDSLSTDNKLNKEFFTSLILKLKDPNTSARMGFRENMAFILGLSHHFLKKCAINWSTDNNLNKRKIKYEYIN